MARESQSERPVRPANQRSAARLAAVQALYQMDVGNGALEEVLAEFETWRLGHEVDGVQYRGSDAPFFREIVSGVVRDQREIDPLIHQTLAATWPLVRIDITLRAILRAACHELKSRGDVPARVVITEYVEIAKAFFGEDEPRVANAVLDRIARVLRPAEFVPAKGTL